ncbi:hypothetical protein C5167_015271 [Papaver somniferum]|uniref:Uncharacterized protein n=1 Tax=Papaver somniferum TaxID=3469 RepID=A0A4Y7J5K8_PAPSO|nr:hypothetical protein C5167_015271 [Papaver somniferum]
MRISRAHSSYPWTKYLFDSFQPLVLSHSLRNSSEENLSRHGNSSSVESSKWFVVLASKIDSCSWGFLFQVVEIKTLKYHKQKNNGSHGFDSPSEIECKRLKRCSYQAAKMFKVEIRFARKIPMKAIGLSLKGCNREGAIDALRVLDVILKQQATERGCLLIRQFFYRGDVRNFVSVGDGITGVRGFHSSFRDTQSGLALNMDVSTSMTFTPGPVLLTNQRVTDPHQIDWGSSLNFFFNLISLSCMPNMRFQAKRMLKNMLIKVKHNNMEFKIKGLSEKPCKDFFLMKMRDEDCKNEVKTFELTVYDYFTKHRKLELTTSEYMPCIDVGRPKKPNYIPLESQASRAYQISDTFKHVYGLFNIIRLFNFINIRYDADPSLSACGVSIEKQLIPVEGHVLGTPGLKVNNVDCFPDNGKWNYCGQAIVNFSALWDTSNLSRELINGARNKGVQMDPPHWLIEEDYQSRRLPPIARVERMSGPWKNKCLSEEGIATQCLTPAKINDLYITNVLLKINNKLGGKNSLLAVEHVPRIPVISETPTIILGMDVSHAAPGRSDVPSIAAQTAVRKKQIKKQQEEDEKEQDSEIKKQLIHKYEFLIFFVYVSSLTSETKLRVLI